jgi:hypothetical protein
MRCPPILGPIESGNSTRYYTGEFKADQQVETVSTGYQGTTYPQPGLQVCLTVQEDRLTMRRVQFQGNPMDNTFFNSLAFAFVT